MKTIFRIILGVFLLIFCMGTALAENAPRRIAVLPVIDQAGISSDLQAALEKRLADEVHVPLNEALQAVAYVPADESTAALQKLLAVPSATGTTHSRSQIDLAQEMKPLADALSADLVVVLLVTDCWEVYHQNYWDDDSTFYLESQAAVRLVGYDRRNDRIINEHANRFYRAEYSPEGTAAMLCGEAADEVLRKAMLKKAIFPLEGTEAKVQEK